MRAMKLTGLRANGRVTLVDDEDYDWLRKFTWRFDDHTGYAKTQVWNHDQRRAHTRKLHNLLLPPKQGWCADHINRDKLDNRRANLRYVTKGENNRNAFRCDNTSGYTGVSPTGTKLKPWVARLRRDGIYHHLGCFETPEAAAAAYTNALDNPALLPGVRIKRWSKQEWEILRTVYPKQGSKAVSKLTGRPISAIRCQACKHGISYDGE
jgi:hypothetical protein